MKKWKKWLCLLAVICAALLWLPTEASAEDDETIEILYSGKCGETLSWELDSNGTLTISGTGEMYNYYYKTDSPWFYHREQVYALNLSQGITHIGRYSFWGFEHLTSVILPYSLTSIGSAAFTDCNGLTSITFPDGLFSIGDSAFIGCDGFTSITFPEGLNSIGRQAFSNCDGLTTVAFPDGLATIGYGAFSQCNGLTSITYPNSLTNMDGRVFSACNNLTSITFPSGLTSIGEEAFYDCDGLTTVTLPDGLTTIEDGAFACCSGLTGITLPDSLTSIGYEAFYLCDNLTDVYYKGTESQWEAITIGNRNSPLLNATIHYNYVESPFTDVPIDKWFSAPVLWAVEQGITNGMGDGTFGVNLPCNRAQVVTFLWRSAGSPEPSTTTTQFRDVDVTKWYGKPVLWAVENGITNGISTTEFGIDQPCNRATVVTFLWRVRGEPAPVSNVSPFTDVPAGKWFTEPVLWAVENGITNGMGDGTFGINGICNRAQVVTFLYRTFAQ